VSLADASINPSNGVAFPGWVVPDAETTMDNLRTVLDKGQALANETITRLQSFVRNIPELSLIDNSTRALICDLILIDEELGVSYHVKHRSHAPGDRAVNLLSLLPKWGNPRLNWNFLFY
jgi:hypothetical protein